MRIDINLTDKSDKKFFFDSTSRLENLILNRNLPTFATRKDSAKAARDMGWKSSDVVCVARRFETVWLVCQTGIDFISECADGYCYQTYIFPTGFDSYGNIETVKIKKHINKN